MPDLSPLSCHDADAAAPFFYLEEYLDQPADADEYYTGAVPCSGQWELGGGYGHVGGEGVGAVEGTGTRYREGLQGEFESLHVPIWTGKAWGPPQLTDQAVATGDLTQKIIVPVKGQAMTELKDIINSMVDRLTTFAVEVERVSLEVGTEGRLGGQAVVQGVEGTWRDLTAVVNTLAANLTTQVRSIAKVTKVCWSHSIYSKHARSASHGVMAGRGRIIADDVGCGTR